MLTVVLVAAAWVVVGWLPGYLLVDALRPAAGWLRNAALAPMAALGLTMIAGQGLQILRVRIDPWTVLPLSIGVPLLGWAWVTLRRRRSVSIADGAADRGVADPDRGTDAGRLVSPSRLDRRLLVLAVLLGLVIWCVAIPSLASVLPRDDGTHHGLYAYRILTLGTLDPHKILTGDLATGTPAVHYYPLALHLISALIAGVTGAPVNAVLTVGYVLFASVLLPVGIFVLTRRMFPQLPAAAGVAAVLSTTFPWFPYQPIFWGAVPTIVAMSCVPAAVDAVWRPRADGPAVAVGLALGVAGYGVFTTHNSELLTIGLYGLLLTWAGRRSFATGERRRLFTTWAAGVALILILTAPQLPQLLAGAQERTRILDRGSHSNSDSVWAFLLVVGNPLILLFAVLGLVIAVSRRWCPGWLWALLATAALGASTATTSRILADVTAPWYASLLRISYMFSYFEAVYGAIGVLVLGRAVVALLTRKRLVRPRLAMPTVIAFLTAVTAVAVVPEAVYVASLGYRTNSLIGPDQRAGFAWLSAHVEPGERVLNQFSDGSGWMQTLDDVTPVFATTTNQEVIPPESVWGDRWYLLTHAGSLSTDPRAQAAARTWDVRYVYVNGRSFFGIPGGQLSAATLSRSSAYQEVWHRGTVTIFEIAMK